MWIRWALVGVSVVVAFGAWGCSDDGDGGGGAGVDAGASNTSASNTGVSNGGAADTGADEDAALDTGGEADTETADTAEVDVAEPECLPGERRCEDDGVALACQPTGMWSRRICDEGFVCRDPGECSPDPNACVEGQRICLNGAPAECAPGEDWRPLLPCPGDEVCLSGECRSRACGQAAASASYLGCDYVAVDIPNIAYASIGGTERAPLGIVLANPDPVNNALFTVYGADGELAELVSQVEVFPPALPLLGDFDPVTVRTEIWDGMGNLANANFDRARELAIPPSGMAIVLLEHHGSPNVSVVRQHAWRIATDSPIAAYQFGPYCCNFSFTNDASLLLPVQALGTEYVFLGVPSWNSVDDDPNNPNSPPVSGGYAATLTLIGTRPGTVVEVDLPPGASVLPDTDGRVTIQGQRVSVALKAQEVLHLFSGWPEVRNGELRGVDLSGAQIRANKPVAAFSGHQCTFYPQDQGACDHLEEQLFPSDTWGTEYALVPPVLRTSNPAEATEAIYWKMLALEDDTRIRLSRPMSALEPRAPGFVGVPDCVDRLDGADTIVLGSGEYCEFGTRVAVIASGDKPFQVMGIFSGQNTTITDLLEAITGQHAGDPAIFMVPPQLQYRNQYAFLTPTTYFNDYLTVVAPEGTMLQLDGEAVDLTGATEIAGSNMVYAHIQVEDGPHTVEGNRPFGILVYAFDDYVSYAFTGGLNLLKRP